LTPSRPSRAATIRDTEGCETPSSRATREKLPASAAVIATMHRATTDLMPARYVTGTDGVIA
jgi:hypothetical protein